MTELVLMRDKIKNLYAKYDFIFDIVLKFVATFIAVSVINSMTGYNPKLSGIIVTLAVSIVGALVSGGVTALICCLLAVLQIYSLSLEYAAITLMVVLIMLLSYYLFAPRTSYVLLLVPVLYALKLPYLLPIVIGLTAGVSGVIPAVFGTYLYFTLKFASSFEQALSSFGKSDFVPKLTYVIDNTILNKEMIVMCICFAAIIILVSLLKSFSFDRAWTIAIVVGGIVEAVIVIMSHIMMGIPFSMGGLIIGVVLAMVVAVILQFFIFSVDYSRTERVQFEDDDYVYYVKAVPKVAIAKTNVTVKKINKQHNENSDASDMDSESYEPETDSDYGNGYQESYEETSNENHEKSYRDDLEYDAMKARAYETDSEEGEELEFVNLNDK